MENKDKITPIDIMHAQFDGAFRGYNQKQVDDFLDKLVVDYEQVIQENVTLKKENEKLREEFEKMHSLEQTMQKAMVTAQKTSENLIEGTKKEVEELKRKKDSFVLEFKNSLKTMLEYLEKIDIRLDKNIEDNSMN